MMMQLASVTIGLFDDVDSLIFPHRNWRPELPLFGPFASMRMDSCDRPARDPVYFVNLVSLSLGPSPYLTYIRCLY